MAATVDQTDPGQLGQDQVRSGNPVRGVQWASIARACNYLNGSARAIIPHAAVGLEMTKDSTPRAISFRVFPSYQATHRMWLVTLAPPAEDEAVGDRFRMVDPSGGTAIWTMPGTTLGTVPALAPHIERITSRTASETTLAPTFESVEGVHVLSTVACFELPRPSLALNANDLGVEMADFGPGAPIYDGTGRSLGALPEAIAGALSRGRRTMFQWGRPDAFAVSTTSGTFSRVVGPMDPTLLERILYVGETQVLCPWRVRAWCTAGTTGEVRIQTTSGGDSTIAVSATSATWHSDTVLVDVEDLSAADGRRDSSDCIATIEFRRTSGAGSLFVSGLSIHGRAS